MRTSRAAYRSSSALVVYMIILMSMQIFLVTLAAEAFMANDTPLAWATAAVSVGLFATAFVFYRWLRP